MRERDRRVSRRSVLTGVTATGLSVIGQRSLAQTAPAVLSPTKIAAPGYYRTPAFHITSRRGLFATEGLEVEFVLVRLAAHHNEGMAQGRWPLTALTDHIVLARTTAHRM